MIAYLVFYAVIGIVLGLLYAVYSSKKENGMSGAKVVFILLIWLLIWPFLLGTVIIITVFLTLTFLIALIFK